MRFRIVLVFLFLASWLRETETMASITYVDATTANTTLNGAPLLNGTNFTSGPNDGAMDNLWHLHTGVGNGNNGIWTADESGVGAEDVAPLVTTISLPDAGGYRMFAYIWSSENAGEDWDAKIRIGASGVYSKIQASEADAANSTDFDGLIVTNESLRRLIQIPLGIITVTTGTTTQIYIDDDVTSGSRRTWYDGVGYEKVFGTLGERIIAIDGNKTNTPGAPSQAMFRSLGGSSTTSQNKTNMTKLFGSYAIQFSKTSATPFDFRGANGDSTRIIPGGPTSLSFLVADFLGARDGTINIGISNLASGTYLFRSYHLDTFNSGNLGYAQGNSSTNQNTLRAHVGGSLQAVIQPTALGIYGINTNFISNFDIPTLAFAFNADGTNAVGINLSTIYTNGVDRFILLNGFEIFSTNP